MAGVLGGETLPFENVAEVAATVIAENFDPTAVGIPNFPDGARYFIIKARPATAAAKLVLTIVKRVITAPANKDTVDLEVIILIGKGHFCAFTDNDTLFISGEGVVIFRSFHGVLTPEGSGRFYHLGPLGTRKPRLRLQPTLHPALPP